MVSKKKVELEIKELKAQVQAGKVIIGAERVLKALRAGKLKKVFMASNCPQKVKGDLQHYAQLVNIPLISLELSNEELGVFCKKNFFVSVLGTNGE